MASDIVSRLLETQHSSNHALHAIERTKAARDRDRLSAVLRSAVALAEHALQFYELVSALDWVHRNNELLENYRAAKRETGL